MYKPYNLYSVTQHVAQSSLCCYNIEHYCSGNRNSFLELKYILDQQGLGLYYSLHASPFLGSLLTPQVY